MPALGKQLGQSECSDQWGFVMLYCHTEAGWPFLILHGCLGAMRRLCLVLRWSLKVPGEVGVSLELTWKFTEAEGFQQEHMAQLVSGLPLEYPLLSRWSLDHLYCAAQKWLSDQVFCSHPQAVVAAHLLDKSWFI